MKYKITKKIPFRTGPGKKYTKMGVLKPGTLITFVSRKGNWVKFVKNKKYFYCNGKYLEEVVDYGIVVSKRVLPLAKLIVKNKAKHVSGAYRYKKTKVNCSVFVSKVLQNAGLLDRNSTLYHTDKNHTKKTLKDVAVNRTKVKHYKWHKINKLYSDMPKKWKVPGCIYVYKSSIGIVGADGIIYGCHSSGSTYTKLSMIRHNKKSYEYTSYILAVGVPKVE